MRSSHWAGSSGTATAGAGGAAAWAEVALSTISHNAIHPSRSLLSRVTRRSAPRPCGAACRLSRVLRIVVHVLGCLLRPIGSTGGSRFARHEGGQQIAPGDGRGELTVGDDIVGELSGRHERQARARARNDI